MASRYRHVLSTPGEVRLQVTFRRTDLLYRHVEPLRDPHAAAKTRRARAEGLEPDELVVEVPQLPLMKPSGVLVGPTIHDMLVRARWRFKELPNTTQRAARERFAPKKPPPSVIAWSVRDLATLWPQPGEPQKRAPAVDLGDDEERPLDHPFLASLASGGELIDDTGEWLVVRKRTTCQVGQYVFRAAAGMYGGVDQAYTAIAAAAVEAWEKDQARALKLWELVQHAPGNVLLEDEEIAKLRPICSISQEVERTIMREVCRWIGVDPELDVRRPRGRPRGAEGTSEEGKYLRVVLERDGTVRGFFLAPYRGVDEGTELHELALDTLVSVLGAFRTEHLDSDATLLEAWLDAAIPDWRDRVVDNSVSTTSSSTAADPYDVLGVTPDAPMSEITAAYRKAMKAVHPDTSGASAWLSRMVIDAYQKIRAARAQRGGDV